MGPLSWRQLNDPTGVRSPAFPIAPTMVARHAVSVAALWFYNLTAGVVIRALSLVFALLAHRMLLNMLVRSVSSTEFGVSDHEFRHARIEVVPVPSLSAFFEQEV